MNWLTLLMKSLQLVPVLVAGIEHIHGEAPGATKKQMAMDALRLAWGSASTVLPGEQPAIDAATVLASNTIDDVVDVFNQAGVFKNAVAKTPSLPAPIAQMPTPVAAAAIAAVPDPPPAAAAAPTATSTTNKTGD